MTRPSKKRKFWNPYTQVLSTALGACFCLWIISSSLQVQDSSEITQSLPDPESAPPLANIDPSNPLRIHVEVDYDEGEEAAWYPKNESPLLEELVKEGALPPVQERVGPEPIVYAGVEGIGKYGGSMILGEGTLSLSATISYTTLFRFSPQGLPVVPHLASGYAVSEDLKTYTVNLRKGVRWSDGHPFTADDILFWWNDNANNANVGKGFIPWFMKTKGKTGKIRRIDDYTLEFSFSEPHGLFIQSLASEAGRDLVKYPKHYLQRYHPDIGDKNLIANEIESRRLASPSDLYTVLQKETNPEHPRLWPWVLQVHQTQPPFRVVRNPYYYMVDIEGNQLPYIDRILLEEPTKESTVLRITNGHYSFFVSKPVEATALIDSQQLGNYYVKRWFRGDRSDAMIHVNLNRNAEEGDLHTQWKASYLKKRKFRQALSMAINREDIIELAYFGATKPAQVVPGPESIFYQEEAFKAFTQYDPERANALLDEIGLNKRDLEGYRTAPDGTSLVFFLTTYSGMNPALPQFVAEDWAKVGVRTIARIIGDRLYEAEREALIHDFNMWTGECEYYPILKPRVFVPLTSESNFAPAYARWYTRGGLHGAPDAVGAGRIAIPEGHPLRESLHIYERFFSTNDTSEHVSLFHQLLDISRENVWTIGLCTSPDYVVTIKNGLRNVPSDAISTWTFQSPGNTGLETFFFEDGAHSKAIAAQIKKEIQQVVPPPESVNFDQSSQRFTALLSTALRVLFIGIVVLFFAVMAVRHPFVGKRLILFIPTMAVISVIIFAIIELPPGDFLTSKIMELEMKGNQISEQEIADVKALFHLDKPVPLRYAHWMGLKWFVTFDEQDTGLLQGNLGRSMEEYQHVNRLLGDRMLMTVIISIGTILITWSIALPIGIYSAVRQYSFGDHFFTLIGFIGMCVPSFLFALILSYFSRVFFNVDASGLFSEQYAIQPYWDWAKVVDLLKHVWVPIVILGISGTGGMIRVMRGNLLDELKKPYVTTARAKGMRPFKLIMKYPVRLALNPFISGIGGIFPFLISGATLVAVVLNLPTVGPLMYRSMLIEDTMLAGSILMILSLLSVIGVLVSDLLLLWLDPRIRMEGQSA